ncbi:hypothetical protein STCU_01169 [Strigomonas culicis]|uniref:Uncharacterized protein n=1 Tax=Strigomonas culicis TaxID=28005 RepID=S9UWJ8_9TRYP|nr:hypothetical protein STCU_01169 [Strigomonas culicis]|eukprot:EPY35262.1 hypothetical protein STCU_01169 [Strigomonas culicis]
MSSKETGLKTSDLNFSLHAPTESPFITNPAAADTADIPPEYTRRVEDAQRVFSKHYMQYKAYQQAWDHATVTVGIQCMWLGVAMWVVSRGLRYSDPINSVVARWVTHPTVRRLTTPISCLGLFIFSVTLSQVPYDVKLILDANTYIAAEEELMKAALEQRQAAYEEGKRISDNLKESEKSTFLDNMQQKIK